MLPWKKGAIGFLNVGGKLTRVKVLRVNKSGGSLSVEITGAQDKGVKLCVQPYDLKPLANGWIPDGYSSRLYNEGVVVAYVHKTLFGWLWVMRDRVDGLYTDEDAAKNAAEEAVRS